ncbi:STING domain-containing protein [Marinoscillum sp.]|uniref:STING domain-containing protein n=1 Tax=Marinoscillum sp. TaxID=2024838 RepID=UPI003BA8D86E
MRKILNNSFTIITVGLFVLWLILPDKPYWEATIGILFIAKEVIIRWQMRKIEVLEFSPAISLAHGYVNNFLEPAINELLSKYGNDVKFIIYIPHDLEELSDQQIDRMKIQIEADGYKLKEIKLKRKSGRPHDILTIEKHSGSVSYFDFPRTLLSLQSYIDYKVETAKNELSEEKQLRLGKKLVDAFKNEVQRLITKKNLNNKIHFVNKSLEL